MALRRPHRKSRHGCVECKRRRVKCDESRPSCTNCANRYSECEYGSSSSLLWANEGPDSGQTGEPASGLCSPSSSTIGTGAAESLGILTQLGSENAVTSAGSALNLNDLELMIQWCSTTFQTLSRNERTDPIWRTIVPEEALSHPFLMHGILALSSLHLARTGPEPARRASYLNRAVAHQNQALALFRELLGDVKESNAKAMLAFAGIVVIYTFAFPHTPEAQDPWDCVDDLYQVLVLTRGVQQVIHAPQDFTSFLGDSSFGPILQVEEARGTIPEDTTAMLTQLREANKICGERDPNHEIQVYEGSISNLEEMLSWCYSGMRANTIAGRWAIRLHPRFMELLRERDPLALVMLAHYVVLLQYLKHRWCFDEWCVRVSKAVWAILDDQWRPLIQWAMKEILGINYMEQVDT
ncbi:Aflatoxin biosynthesis regulatory protein [Penicillium digitatum]|nr:Aflatoxin biosynthesis regulatory protein [Penicillium digitatum]